MEASVDNIVQKAQAVVTRQMEINEKKLMKPLRVTAEIEASTTHADVVRLQKADNTLTTSWNNVDNTHTADDLKPGETKFKIKGELLYRILKTRDGRMRSQLVLLKEMREKALRLAHEGIMSGHQGISKTTDRLSRA